MKLKSIFFVATFACSLFGALAVHGASYANGSTSVTAKRAASVYVDKQGVMRDAASRDEVAYYGVNYTLPLTLTMIHPSQVCLC